MNLNDKYPYFIYIINKETNYDFSYLNNYKYYSNSDREQFENDKYNQLAKLKLACNIQCQLYISPFILKCYYDLKEKDLNKNYLPAIPYICENEKYYIIL